MSDSKVIMFPESAGTNGFDPNLLLSSIMNNGGFGGNNWVWIIFLFFLFGYRNNGMFGNSEGTGFLSDQINNGTGRELLMQAINGNGNAISQLSSTLSCDVNSIKTAINSVQSSICQVGNQVGMSAADVRNAISMGNMQLSQQLAQCCCDNKQLIITQGYENQIATLNQTNVLQQAINQNTSNQERGFAQVGYAAQQQTCDIQNSIKSQTQTIMDKLASMQADVQQDKINTLTAQLTAANARAERAAELRPILDELNHIKCAQPSTTTVQYPQLTAIPTAMYNLVQGGYSGGGFWG